MNQGIVSQIIGPVVDVQFQEDKLPEIYNALEVELNKKNLVLEVQQHLGDGVVRAVAMDSTDGLKRGVANAARSRSAEQDAGRAFPQSNKISQRLRR